MTDHLSKARSIATSLSRADLTTGEEAQRGILHALIAIAEALAAPEADPVRVPTRDSGAEAGER